MLVHRWIHATTRAAAAGRIPRARGGHRICGTARVRAQRRRTAVYRLRAQAGALQGPTDGQGQSLTREGCGRADERPAQRLCRLEHSAADGALEQDGDRDLRRSGRWVCWSRLVCRGAAQAAAAHHSPQGGVRQRVRGGRDNHQQHGQGHGHRDLQGSLAGRAGRQAGRSIWARLGNGGPAHLEAAARMLDPAGQEQAQTSAQAPGGPPQCRSGASLVACAQQLRPALEREEGAHGGPSSSGQPQSPRQHSSLPRSRVSLLEARSRAPPAPAGPVPRQR